jgi:hypothetical protein
MAMLFEVFPTQAACHAALERNRDKDWTDLARLACVQEKDTRVFVTPRHGPRWQTQEE